jgi:hypothetical protein
MTIAELLTRKRSKKLEIDENKCLTIINYLPSFLYISSISRNQSWIRTIVKLCFYDDKFIENAHNKNSSY